MEEAFEKDQVTRQGNMMGAITGLTKKLGGGGGGGGMATALNGGSGMGMAGISPGSNSFGSAVIEKLLGKSFTDPEQ